MSRIATALLLMLCLCWQFVKDEFDAFL